MKTIKRYEALRDEIIRFIKENDLKPMDKLPTVREIISKMGYSYATVNRTLIEMEKEGLIRKEHGRGLFVNRLSPLPKENPYQVAMIIPQEFKSYRIYLDLILGIKRILENRGAVLSIYDNQSHDLEINTINELIHKPVDGLIIYLEDHYKEIHGFDHIKKLVDIKFPFVLVDRYISELQTNYVVVDNEIGVLKIGAYLKYRKNCQKIIYIRPEGVEFQVSSTKAKIEGFKKAADMFFGDKNPAMMVLDEFINQIEYLSEQKITIGVIFCYDEQIMLMNKKFLEARKFLPQNIQVFGYANVLPQPMYPTVEQCNDKVGEQAAEILIDSIQNPRKDPAQIKIDPKLVLPNEDGTFYIEE